MVTPSNNASTPSDSEASLHRATESAPVNRKEASDEKPARRVRQDTVLRARISKKLLDEVEQAAKASGVDLSRCTRELIEEALKTRRNVGSPTSLEQGSEGKTDQPSGRPKRKVKLPQKAARLRPGYSPLAPNVVHVGKDIDPGTTYPPCFDPALFYSVLTYESVRLRNVLVDTQREIQDLREKIELLLADPGHPATSLLEPFSPNAIDSRIRYVEISLDHAIRTARGELPILLSTESLDEFGRRPAKLAPEMATCLRRSMEATQRELRSQLDPDLQEFFYPEEYATTQAQADFSVPEASQVEEPSS